MLEYECHTLNEHLRHDNSAIYYYNNRGDTRSVLFQYVIPQQGRADTVTGFLLIHSFTKATASHMTGSSLFASTLYILSLLYLCEYSFQNVFSIYVILNTSGLHGLLTSLDLKWG